MVSSKPKEIELGSYRQISKQSGPDIPDVLTREDRNYWEQEIGLCNSPAQLWQLYDEFHAKEHYDLANSVWVRVGILETLHGRYYRRPGGEDR